MATAYGGRFGANGETEPVPTPAELGAASQWVGDVDENGHYWLVRMTGDPGAWFQVDVRPDSPSFGQLVESGTATMPDGLAPGGDWSYLPGTDSLYQTFFGGGSTFLYRFDRQAQQYELVGDSGVPAQLFGATSADPDGFIYGYANISGEIYRFDTSDGTATRFAQGLPATNNDGARCFTVQVPVDFGDAPDSYGTLLASDGARHSVVGFDAGEEIAPLMLGTRVGVETDGQPSAGADANPYDDGVAEPIQIASGSENTLTVTTTNHTDEDALLAGWIDLDGSGTFDAGELVTQTVPASPGRSTTSSTSWRASRQPTPTHDSASLAMRVSIRRRPVPRPVARSRTTGSSSSTRRSRWTSRPIPTSWSRVTRSPTRSRRPTPVTRRWTAW